MTGYDDRQRPPGDDPRYRPGDHDDEATSWIDRGPLAHDETSEYHEPPRRYSTEDHTYRDPGFPAAGQSAPRPSPDDQPTEQFRLPPHPDEPTHSYPPHPDEPTHSYPPAGEAGHGYPPHAGEAGHGIGSRTPPAADPATRYGDEPTQEVPYLRPEPPPQAAPRHTPPPAVPPNLRPPPTDADATVVMPKLRNAPEAPPTPLPKLRFPADTTMVMSAVPYFTPSATPAYTGTIYVSYAASLAQMEDEAAAAPEAEREGAAASVARNSAVMALGSIVSRITGFLRVAVLGAALGGATVGNTYTAANTVPSMVYELLLGGILTSVLVPLLVRAREHDADKGQAFTQRLLTLSVITLGVAAVIAVAAAPLLTAVMSSDNHGEAQRQLMTSLAYLLLPEVFFFGIAGVLAAVLNTRGHFAAPMWTPILNNAVVIGTFVAFMVISDQPTLTPENMTTGQILVLGIGTTLGIAAQACGLIPALRRVGFRWRWRFDFRELHLGELGRIAGWMACYVAVSQVGVLVIIRLSYAAGSAEVTGGTPAGPLIYNNAFLLFMMAHGIVAVSIITALMPRMSAAAANDNMSEVVRNISLGTRLTSVVLIPVTGVYMVLGTSIATVLFRWGRFTESEAQAAALVVAVAGLGLVPFAISQLQTFAFYALTETKTAALVNIPVVATKVAVDLAIYYTVPAQYVAAGLMLGNLCSYVLGAVISARLLRARLGPMRQREVFATLVRLALAGAAGAVACFGALHLLDPLLGDSRLAHIVRIVVGGGVLAVVYLVAAWAMRVREISDVLDMVNRKLGGRLPLPSRREAPRTADPDTTDSPLSELGPAEPAPGGPPAREPAPWAGTAGDGAAGPVVAPAYPDAADRRQPGYRAEPDHRAEPGYRADSGYRAEPGYPTAPDRWAEPGYRHHPSHPGGAHPERSHYPDPRSHYPDPGAQPRYPDPPYRPEPTRSEDPWYPGEAEHGVPPYPKDPAEAAHRYPVEPDDPHRRGPWHPRQDQVRQPDPWSASGDHDHPGHRLAHDPRYPDHGRHPGEARHPGTRPADPGYLPEPGYLADAGTTAPWYRGQPGYPAEPGYQAEPGYLEEPARPERRRNPDDPTDDPRYR